MHQNLLPELLQEGDDVTENGKDTRVHHTSIVILITCDAIGPEEQSSQIKIKQGAMVQIITQKSNVTEYLAFSSSK